MKKTVLSLLAGVLLLASASCAPKVRFVNDWGFVGLTMGMSSLTFQFDESKFEVVDLDPEKWTRYKPASLGDAHKITMTYIFSAGGVFIETVQNDANLGLGKKYTVYQNINRIQEDVAF